MSTLTRITRHALAIFILSATAWALPPAPVAQAQGCDRVCCFTACFNAARSCHQRCFDNPFPGCVEQCSRQEKVCHDRCACGTSPCP